MALKEFQDLCQNNIVLIATDNTTVVAYMNKEGVGVKLGSVSPSVENPDLVYQQTGPLVADKLSRLGQTIQSGLFQAKCNRFHHPQIHLFAMRFNNKLAQYVSPVPDPQAWAVDALSLLTQDLDSYAFPPAAILGKVVEKFQDYPSRRIILIAVEWPNMPWFWDLVAMSSQIPVNLPKLLTQPFNQTPHRNLSTLNLHAWLREPQQSRSKASLRQWQYELRLLKEDLPDQSMRQSGPFLQNGASVIRWT